MATSTSEKPKRNTEQRRPRKATLNDYFPTITKQTIRHQPSVTQSDHRSIRTKSNSTNTKRIQNKIQQRKKQKEKRLQRTITPESQMRGPKRGPRNVNHIGTKTNRSISMEFHKKQGTKLKRQSTCTIMMTIYQMTL